MNINELKTTYQRNMLLGQIISCLIAVLVILIILSFQDSYVIVKRENAKYLKPFSFYPENNLNIIKDQNKNAIEQVGLIRDSDLIRFDRRQNQSYSPVFIYDQIGQHNLSSSINQYGNVIDDEWRIGNPENWGGDWPVQNQNSLIDRYTFDNYSSSHRFSAPKENRPLIIDFIKPRYPGGLRFKVDAIVKLGFYINAKGRIDKIDVISEQPEGFDFALAVKEALRESWIKPAVIDGIKTGGYYTLTYEFCEKCPSKPVVIESSSNVIVTIK